MNAEAQRAQRTSLHSYRYPQFYCVFSQFLSGFSESPLSEQDLTRPEVAFHLILLLNAEAEEERFVRTLKDVVAHEFGAMIAIHIGVEGLNLCGVDSVG